MSELFNGNLPLVLATWMIVVFILFIARSRRDTAGSGLVLAYVLNLWMIHWAASAMYILPWYHGPYEAMTVSGTEQSLYAVAAFAFGSIALAPFVISSGMLPRATGLFAPDRTLPRTYLLVGAFFYVLMSTFLGRLPTVTAVISTGQSLVVVGLGLCCLQAWGERDYRRMTMWLALSFLPPFFTVITRGFIGYGAVATLSVLIFLANFVRSRVALIVAGVLLGYVAISVYVTYMRDRSEIRASVWGGDAFSSRLSLLEETVGGFEWFDPTNQEHLRRIDDRLNQSYLVGAAVEHLAVANDYAHGETLFDAVLALIPRALWPDKPIVAGSSDLVPRFTGLHFDTTITSVGMGAVMEFYINFGTAGILIGFSILGMLVTTLDVLATERLMSGDINGFVMYYLPGLGFLQVGGQLVEITAGVAGAIIVTFITNKYLANLQTKLSETVPDAEALAAAEHV